MFEKSWKYGKGKTEKILMLCRSQKNYNIIAYLTLEGSPGE